MSSCPICGEKFASEHGVKVHAGRSHDTSLAGETVACATCGTEISRQPYEVQKYENHFCSDKCETEWRSERYSGEKNPYSSGRVSITCKCCNKDFEVAPYREQTARFCSVDCKATFQSEELSGADSHAWEGGPETAICEYCGDKFEFYASEGTTRRFCSYECLGRAREETMQGEQNPSWDGGKETLECETCGERYEVFPANAEKSRFCSYECVGRAHQQNRSGANSPRWRGGYEPYYGPNWHQQRYRRLAIDQARCQDCGMTDAESHQQYDAELEVHHQVPFREFAADENTDYKAANALDNLITLCKSCHSQRE